MVVSRGKRQGGPGCRARAHHLVVLFGILFRFFRAYTQPNVFQHCQAISGSPDAMEGFASTSTMATIPVQDFTPILATLLLSSNPQIVGSARFAVVDLLTRMSKADERESGVSSAPSTEEEEESDGENAYAVGLFKAEERDMLRQEILHSVVIGMGRLGDEAEEQWAGSPMHVRESSGENQFSSMSIQSHSPSAPARPQSPAVNPYFPVTPPPAKPAASPTLAPPSIHQSLSTSPVRSPEEDQHASFDIDEQHRLAEHGNETDEEQAAIGQLSCMSLIAAVTATGKHLPRSSQRLA